MYLLNVKDFFFLYGVHKTKFSYTDKFLIALERSIKIILWQTVQPVTSLCTITFQKIFTNLKSAQM